MSLIFGFILLLAIYVIYKLFIDGWLFKIILFVAGWFGIYIALRAYVGGANATAFTLENGTSCSWAFLIPSVICLLCLACTKVQND